MSDSVFRIVRKLAPHWLVFNRVGMLLIACAAVPRIIDFAARPMTPAQPWPFAISELLCVTGVGGVYAGYCLHRLGHGTSRRGAEPAKPASSSSDDQPGAADLGYQLLIRCFFGESNAVSILQQSPAVRRFGCIAYLAAFILAQVVFMSGKYWPLPFVGVALLGIAYPVVVLFHSKTGKERRMAFRTVLASIGAVTVVAGVGMYQPCPIRLLHPITDSNAVVLVGGSALLLFSTIFRGRS